MPVSSRGRTRASREHLGLLTAMSTKLLCFESVNMVGFIQIQYFTSVKLPQKFWLKKLYFRVFVDKLSHKQGCLNIMMHLK